MVEVQKGAARLCLIQDATLGALSVALEGLERVGSEISDRPMVARETVSEAQSMLIATEEARRCIGMPVVDRLRRRWVPVDWIVAAYTTWMGLLIAWFSAQVDIWARLLAIHAILIVVLLIIPPRGSPWEARRWRHLWQRTIFQFVRFVRYVYPLPLALFFFEEGQFTVNMIFPETPYWFEPHLYAADTAIFGDLPARLLAPWLSLPLTEVAYFFTGPTTSS